MMHRTLLKASELGLGISHMHAQALNGTAAQVRGPSRVAGSALSHKHYDSLQALVCDRKAPGP